MVTRVDEGSRVSGFTSDGSASGADRFVSALQIAQVQAAPPPAQQHLVQPQALGDREKAVVNAIFGFDVEDAAPGILTYDGRHTLANVGLGGLGHSGTPVSGDEGLGVAYIDRAKAREFGKKFGVSPDTVAVQEVVHKVVASHPSLAGRFSLQENEVLGELGSLMLDDGFAAATLRNALFGHKGVAKYFGIAGVTGGALDDVAKKHGLRDGQQLLNDLQVHLEQGSPGRGSVDDLDWKVLREFAKMRFGGRAGEFLDDLRTSMKDHFMRAGERIIQSKLGGQ